MGRLRIIICAAFCVAPWLWDSQANADDLLVENNSAGSVLIPEYATSPSEAVTENIAPETAVAPQAQFAPLEASGNSIKKLEAKWKEVLLALKDRPLREVGDRIDELNNQRVELDVSGLQEYSFNLLGRASSALKNNDIAGAAFFSKKALQLSPQSPRLLWNSIGVATKSGVSPSLSNHFLRALGATVQSPQVMLHLLKGSAYPLLWAVTLALLAIFAICFIVHAPMLLVALGKFLPTTFRGLGAPIISLVVLVAPLWFGPLWTIAAWSFFVAMWLPQRRWMAFYGGALVALWGVVIPLRENLNHWLDDPRVVTMLNTASGVFSSSDRSDLAALIKQRPDDGVALFLLGQVLRRYEQYDQAQIAIQRAEALLGDQPWTKAEQGLIAFMTDKIGSADKLFSEAEALGLSSAEFYFDYSRIKFEQVDVASSRDYLAKANHKSARITGMLREREDRFGMKSNRSIAEIRLPLQMILRSGLKPAEPDKTKFDLVAQTVMPGTNPIVLVGIGALLMLVAFARRVGKGPRRRAATYIGYKPGVLARVLTSCVPGCSQFIAGQVGRAVLLMTMAVLVVMPLADWPRESGKVIELLPGFQWYYSVFALAVIGSLVTAQLLARKEG